MMMRGECMRRICCFLIFIATAITLSCTSDTSDQAEQAKYTPYIERNGLAFILVKGGHHIVVLNLDTGEIGTINPGNNAAAMILMRGKGVLTVFSADGQARDIDFMKGTKSEWMHVTNGVCGAASGPSGEIWLTDPLSRKLLLYNQEEKQAKDVLSLERNLCGIFADSKGSRLYLVNPKRSSITVVDASEMRIVDEIDKAGNSIHNGILGPGGAELWIAEGNEFKDGKPYGVGYKRRSAFPGGINIFDIKTNKAKDFIFIGGNVMDLKLSPDGRFAYVISSQMPAYDQATLSVVDTRTVRVMRLYTLCKSCHIPEGVQLPEQKAFVSDLAVDEDIRPESVKGLLDMPFRSGTFNTKSIIRPSNQN
jgi:hypothetical protein